MILKNFCTCYNFQSSGGVGQSHRFVNFTLVLHIAYNRDLWIPYQ